jgi:uncharacterized protein YjeT (DUF2065 family)
MKSGDLREGEGMTFFLCVMGMVLIIEGLPWFGWPEKMKRVMRTMMDQEDSLLRRLGLVMMLAGLLLVYLGKH